MFLKGSLPKKKKSQGIDPSIFKCSHVPMEKGKREAVFTSRSSIYGYPK